MLASPADGPSSSLARFALTLASAGVAGVAGVAAAAVDVSAGDGAAALVALRRGFFGAAFRFELLYGIFVVGYGSTPILLLISFSFFSFLPSFFTPQFLSASHPHPPHRFFFSTADRASLFPFFDYYLFSYSSLLALCIVHLLFWLAIDTEVVPFGWIYLLCVRTNALRPLSNNTRPRKRLYIGCKELVYVVLQVVRIYRSVRCGYILVQGLYRNGTVSW